MCFIWNLIKRFIHQVSTDPVKLILLFGCFIYILNEPSLIRASGIFSGYDNLAEIKLKKGGCCQPKPNLNQVKSTGQSTVQYQHRLINNKTQTVPLCLSQAAVCMPDWLEVQHVIS